MPGWCLLSYLIGLGCLSLLTSIGADRLAEVTGTAGVTAVINILAAQTLLMERTR